VRHDGRSVLGNGADVAVVAEDGQRAADGGVDRAVGVRGHPLRGLDELDQQSRHRHWTAGMRVRVRQRGVGPEPAGGVVDVRQQRVQVGSGGTQHAAVVDDKANGAAPGTPDVGGSHEPLLPPCGWLPWRGVLTLPDFAFDFVDVAVSLVDVPVPVVEVPVLVAGVVVVAPVAAAWPTPAIRPMVAMDAAPAALHPATRVRRSR
jgi:hypothetical protein